MPGLIANNIESLGGSIKPIKNIVAKVNSIYDLLNIDTSKLDDKEQFHVLGFHEPNDGGGGIFYWDANEDKSNHNGGTIISPDAIFPSDWSDTNQQDTWFTSGGTGSGCWKRVIGDYVTPEMFGAKGDGVTDDTTAVQMVADFGSKKIDCNGKIYKITQTLNMSDIKIYNGTFDLHMASDTGVIFGDYCEIVNFLFKSTAYPISNISDTDTNYTLGARKIVSGNHCVFRDVALRDLTTGIDCGYRSNIYMENIYFSQIRSKEGWGAGIHITHSNRIFIKKIIGYDSDRAIEIEANSYNIHIEDFNFEQISSLYAGYSFVLDVHSHEDEIGCRNISFKNGRIYGCKTPVIDVQLSTGTNKSDLGYNVIFENILLEAPESGVVVLIDGHNILLNNITFSNISDTNTSPLISLRSYSYNCKLSNIIVSNYFSDFTTIKIDGSYNYIENLYIAGTSNVGDSSIELIQINGNDNIIKGVVFNEISGFKSYIAIYGKRNIIQENTIRYSDTPPNYGIYSVGDRVSIKNNIFTGTGGATHIYLEANDPYTDGTQPFVFGNIIESGTNQPAIEIGPNVVRGLITQNIFHSSTLTIEDNSGQTNNTVVNNKRGDVYE